MVNTSCIGISNMEVQVSGCVFSSLFLELANSQGDIEGFLLGKIEDRVSTIVSDSQDVNVSHKRIFAVQETVVCPGLFSFYDGVGRIHIAKLDRILYKKKQKVLGWFKFRRSTRLGVSMRERAIHKNLIEQFAIADSKKFVFSVFSSYHTNNLATHAFHYCAHHYIHKHQSRLFDRIPIKIINLGNTAQTEYKHEIASTTSTSKQYQNVIGSYCDEFLDNVGQLQQVEHTRAMYKNMLGKLKGLKEVVHRSELKLNRLSDDVNILRSELENAMRERRLKQSQGSSVDLVDNSEEDLISFGDIEFSSEQSSQETRKHVIVAKHIVAPSHIAQGVDLNSSDKSYHRVESPQY